MPKWALLGDEYHLVCAQPLDPPYDTLLPLGVAGGILLFWICLALWIDYKTDVQQRIRRND
jgi:hypothetical protein